MLSLVERYRKWLEFWERKDDNLSKSLFCDDLCIKENCDYEEYSKCAWRGYEDEEACFAKWCDIDGYNLCITQCYEKLKQIKEVIE